MSDDTQRQAIDEALRATEEQVKDFVPSNPNPAVSVIVLTVVRDIVLVAGGFGYTWAKTVSGDETTMIASTLAVIVAFAWSLLQKKWAAWREHQTALASAAASAAASAKSQTAVAVPVQPLPSVGAL